MNGKTKDNNAVVFIKHLELGGEIVFVVVQNDHTIYTLSPDIYIFVKISNPI